MDQVLLRSVAKDGIRNVFSQQRSYTFSIVFTGILSTFVSVCLFLISLRPDVSVLGQSSVLIQFLALAVLPATWTWLHSGMLKGRGKVNQAIFLDLICIPILAALLLVVSWPSDLTGVAIIYVTSVCFCFLLSIVMLRKELRGSLRLERPTYDVLLIRSSFTFTLITVINSLSNWLPVTISVVFLSTADAGALGVAIRVSALGTLVLSALNSVALHRFATLHAAGDHVGLQKATSSLTALGFLITLPLLLVLIILPEQVMGIFGPDFREASTLLQICAIGQMALAAAGMGSPLLSMTGNERYVRNVVACSVVVLATTTSIGAALGSAEFVAAGVTVSLTIQSALICFFAKRRLGVMAWFDPLALIRLIRP